VKAIIQDIQQKLAEGSYKNEEHVRVCIVLRILQALGWNIWNPGEVNLEFPVLPNEDQTRIDVALFLTPHEPSVFIEVKALGKLESALSQVERQLRDYNRNNTALFSIITDGQIWRFYHSQAGGEFANKCFKILNLAEQKLDDLEQDFVRFLSREAVETGNSEHEAKSYLQLSREQRAMEDGLSDARRLILEPPYPSLPQALKDVVGQTGIVVSIEKATKFINDFGTKRETPPTPEPPEPRGYTVRQRGQTGSLPPDGTECRFAYKGKEFRGRIERGELSVVELGRFSSFSAASVKATRTARNGWRDWEIRLPNETRWVLADTWRSQHSRVKFN
jgi:Type I restriction enzyme R protein N terminus (HSDR_N)